jgi:hypothetical protein
MGASAGGSAANEALASVYACVLRTPWSGRYSLTTTLTVGRVLKLSGACADTCSTARGRACMTIQIGDGMTQAEAQSMCTELNRGAYNDPETHWIARERLPDHWTPNRVRFGSSRWPRPAAPDTAAVPTLLRPF